MSDSFDYEALRAVWVAASGLPIEQVRYSSEGQPFMGSLDSNGNLVGHLLLTVTTDVNVGKDDYPTEFDVDNEAMYTTQVSRGFVTITGRLTEYGLTHALSRMRYIRRRFGGIEIPGMLQALNMSIKDLPQLIYSETPIDDKTHETVVFDAQFNWCMSNDITAELGNANGTDAWIEKVKPIIGTVGV